MEKSALRKKILSHRKKYYLKNLSISSNKLLNFLEKKNLKSKNIGCYYPFNYEFNILNIIETLEKKNYIISLPRVNKNGKMDFFHWSLNDPLKINRYGIPETFSKKKIFPKILLIPLVGFDNQLNRLGYGGGYYDRYISKVQQKEYIIKIGIGFSFQKVKNISINKYDKKLDYIITENNFIE